MKDDIVFMNQLITTAFELLCDHVPERVDTWFSKEIEELKVKEYNDKAFMDDWREKKRIEVYNIISKVQKACYRALDEFVVVTKLRITSDIDKNPNKEV